MKVYGEETALRENFEELGQYPWSTEKKLRNMKRKASMGVHRELCTWCNGVTFCNGAIGKCFTEHTRNGDYRFLKVVWGMSWRVTS